MRGAQGLRFAFDQRTAAVGRFNAKDHFCGFCTSRSQQPRQADDLAGTDLQIERCDRAFFAKTTEGRHRFVTQQRAARTLQRVGIQFPTEHHLHQFDLRQFAGFATADKAAVTQNGDPIADLIDLIEKMGNEDQADAAIAQMPHQTE